MQDSPCGRRACSRVPKAPRRMRRARQDIVLPLGDALVYGTHNRFADLSTSSWTTGALDFVHADTETRFGS